MHNRDFAPLYLKASSRFQSEQPSADHDCLESRATALKQRSGIVEIAKYKHTIFFNVLDRGDERHASSGQQELVKRGDTAIVAGNSFGL